MNPWDPGRLFPSSRFGTQPRQEVNALAAATTIAYGFASLASPAALTALLPVALASGVCLWKTPPYCARCHMLTRHSLAPLGESPLRQPGVPARYRCRNCGSEISRHVGREQ
jgi:hypothetical protein